jgi:hypothetical protein
VPTPAFVQLPTIRRIIGQRAFRILLDPLFVRASGAVAHQFVMRSRQRRNAGRQCLVIARRALQRPVVAFGGEADINGRAGRALPVAIDPMRTSCAGRSRWSGEGEPNSCMEGLRPLAALKNGQPAQPVEQIKEAAVVGGDVVALDAL